MGFIEDNKKIYEESYEKYGDSLKSCHWGESSIFRYEKLTNLVDLNDASVLEVGCGIGGFYEYCLKKNIKNITYKGIDLVQGMIDLAKNKYPEAEFEVCNILEQKLGKQYDYVLMNGVFNMAFSTQDMELMLEEAFKYCKKAMVFNFISTYVNFRQEEMSYHSPQEIFSFCVDHLNRNIRMDHCYERCDVFMVVYQE